MDSFQNGTCADHYQKTNNVGSGQLRDTIWHFTALNLHPNSILNNGKKVRKEEKSSSMLGLFEVFCLCFIISCILSKCTETKNIIHSDSRQNVFSSHSWWPWKRRSVHCRNKSVQTVFLVSHQRFYPPWYSNNQFLTVSSLLWFCPDRDHRKGVIKIIFLSRNAPHMSNTLDQIPVDKTWSPTESSRKMKPEVQ